MKRARLLSLLFFTFASGLAWADAPTLPVPRLETVKVEEAARAGAWATGPVSEDAARQLPAGVQAVAAFRLHRDGPAQDPTSRAAVPQVSLRAAVDPTLGVYVVSGLSAEGGRERTGYWLHGLERSAAGPVMQLPLTSLEPDQDVFLVRLSVPPRADEFALEADPADPAPLGDRVPVILIHGYDGSITTLPFDVHRDRTFEKFMRSPGYRAIQDRVKFYRFAYRPFMALEELGSRFAAVLLREFPDPARPILFVCHSAGGLVTRYAAADPRLRDRVPGIITLATPHHGSVSASILAANGNVSERLGCLDALLMRRSQRGTADTPALHSLFIDNLDGRLSPAAQAHFNMKVNTALAAFNQRDPNAGKIYAYMGEVHHLWGRYTLGIAGELHRRALGQFDRAWSTADPVVHLTSGIFAGAHVAAVRVFKGRSHTELKEDPEVLASVLADLRALCRAALAMRRDRRFGD